MAAAFHRIQIPDSLPGIADQRWAELLRGYALPTAEEAKILSLAFLHPPQFYRVHTSESDRRGIERPAFFRVDAPAPCFMCGLPDAEFRCDGARNGTDCNNAFCAKCSPLPVDGPYHLCIACVPLCEIRNCGKAAFIACQAEEVLRRGLASWGPPPPAPSLQPIQTRLKPPTPPRHPAGKTCDLACGLHMDWKIGEDGIKYSICLECSPWMRWGEKTQESIPRTTDQAFSTPKTQKPPKAPPAPRPGTEATTGNLIRLDAFRAPPPAPHDHDKPPPSPPRRVA